jgi:hypothetical protein
VEANLDPAPGRRFWTRSRKHVAAACAGVGGAIGFGVAGVLAASAAGLQRQADGQSGEVRSTLNDQIARRNDWTLDAALGGALLAATAGVLLVWARSNER